MLDNLLFLFLLLVQASGQGECDFPSGFHGAEVEVKIILLHKISVIFLRRRE
ncbi:hypothetical protein D3C77_633800 [compost metagenome]